MLTARAKTRAWKIGVVGGGELSQEAFKIPPPKFEGAIRPASSEVGKEGFGEVQGRWPEGDGGSSHVLSWISFFQKPI